MPHTRIIERKLTTILAADAANYSGRMNRDEEGTVRALRAARDVIDRAIAQANGRIANTSGDGLIAEFPSVVGAVRCAINIQKSLNQDHAMLPFRLGVHLDDVIIEGADLLGDGVNLAARLQEMAEIGGILISQQVFDHVRGKVGDVELRPLGPATPKHLTEVGLYAVVCDGIKAPPILDNLGPKVDARQPTPVTMPQDVVAMRASFERYRLKVGAGIAALVALSAFTNIPSQATLWPTLVFSVFLFRRWRKLRRVENEQS